MTDFVRVRNVGDTDLRLAYNSQPTVIPAGQEVPVDRDAAATWFGDWTRRNVPELQNPEFRDARLNEYNRIRTLYGFHQLEPESEQTFKAKVPQVEIYEMDGTKVTSILEDPDGKDLPIVGSSNLDKEQLLSAMKDQMDAMAQKIAEMEDPHPDIEVPQDTPETAARRGRPRKAPIDVTGLTEMASRVT